MSISQTDWLRAQLRAQLQRRVRDTALKPGEATTAAAGERPSQAQASGFPRTQSLKNNLVKDEGLLVSALLQDLLSQDFGEALQNDPEFHQAIGTVVETLKADPELWALCLACVSEA